MKTTLLFVITALFALAADEPKKPEVTDAQKLILERIENNTLSAKVDYMDASAKVDRAIRTLQSLKSQHDAAKAAILSELKLDPPCDLVKRQPAGPDGKPIPNKPPDWVADCPSKK
jgi:hypothetical protein